MSKHVIFRAFLMVLVFTLLQGCGKPQPLTRDVLTETYPAHETQKNLPKEVGVIELGATDWAEIQGTSLQGRILIGIRGDTRTNYGSIKLRPDWYGVEWGKEFGFSVLVVPEGHREFVMFHKFFVEAGHTYRLQSGRTYGRGYGVGFWVEDLNSGYNLYEGCQTDSGEGVGTILQLAESGDTRAQYQMGIWYKGSRCLSKDYSFLSDYANAEKWFTLAAEQGSDEAQYTLGKIYHTGVGTKADLKLAFEWYRKAAEQGNMKGEYLVGLFYHKGLFVEQNNMEAEKWYQKSADQGYGPALQRLEELKKDGL